MLVCELLLKCSFFTLPSSPGLLNSSFLIISLVGHLYMRYIYLAKGEENLV